MALISEQGFNIKRGKEEGMEWWTARQINARWNATLPSLPGGGDYCSTVSMFQSTHMSFHALTGC